MANKGGGAEEWMTTFADAITLLLAFFVMLLSMSSIDQEKYEHMSQAISQQFKHGDMEFQVDPSFRYSWFGGDSESSRASAQGLVDAFKELLQVLEWQEEVKVGLGHNGIRIELPNRRIFKAWNGAIRPEAKPIMAAITETLLGYERYHFVEIDVEGHTDDRPIRRMKRNFPTNWDLSAKRATNLLRVLTDFGIDSTKVRAVAYAHTKPKVPNRDRMGNPIQENRKANRRVVLFITERAETIEEREDAARDALLEDFEGPPSIWDMEEEASQSEEGSGMQEESGS